jgi:hypothetical protein
MQSLPRLLGLCGSVADTWFRERAALSSEAPYNISGAGQVRREAEVEFLTQERRPVSFIPLEGLESGG